MPTTTNPIRSPAADGPSAAASRPWSLPTGEPASTIATPISAVSVTLSSRTRGSCRRPSPSGSAPIPRASVSRISSDRPRWSRSTDEPSPTSCTARLDRALGRDHVFLRESMQGAAMSMDWFERNWMFTGMVAGLFLLSLVPLLVGGWSLPLVLIYLQLPIYLFHQLEEHYDDRFRRFF